ncbi:helix-turn-helix transcriptional regulator [Pseudomonas citronellolis]|uniref:helix-turn-helix transcriptional regulator n=1 Tax=Pseudomonas citronellolis TaxID=53408 RepID=UPI0021BE8BC8|nr:LuxR C-terminal-related transcriptional regulator [Pseudomonas citronellolis]UXJ50283.1 LuxR C-terminal-related transcriptional regulator [Pseudomonas citronellolis]
MVPIQGVARTNAVSAVDDALLRLIYEGVLELEPWRAFLREYRNRLRSGYANFAFHRASSGPEDIVAIEDADWDCAAHGERYHTTYGQLDPLPYLAMRPGEHYVVEDTLAGAGAAGECFYREFLQPAGMDHMVILHVAEPGGMRAWLSVARKAPAPPFGADDLALVRAITPHLTSALKLFAALTRSEIERSVYRDAVNHFAIGTVILDGLGRVVGIDEVATRIMADNPELTVRGERLHVQGDGDKALQELIIEGLAAGGRGFCRAMRMPRYSHLGVLVRAVRSPQQCVSETAPALAVHISDTRMERTAPEHQLMTLLGLTQTEAGLAVQLAQGRTLVEAAQALGLTEQTVRTYSKQIFAKTGTRRQADLVRLILTSVASLADDGALERR